MEQIARAMLLALVFTSNPTSGQTGDIMDYVYELQPQFHHKHAPAPGTHVVYAHTNCHEETFPILIGVVCAPNGTLIAADIPNFTTVVKSSTVEARASGWFTLDASNYVLLALSEPKYNTMPACPLQDTYAMELSMDRFQKAQLIINSIQFQHVLRLRIEGCALGRPKVVDAELLECDNEKCQQEMRTPVPLK